MLSEWPTAAAASIGLLDQPTWLDHARQILPPATVDEWLAYHGLITHAAIDVLYQASRAACVILLLGNGTERLADDLAHRNLTDLAANVYLSARTGYANPDPRAWTHLLCDSRTDPARALAVEPRPRWARAARQTGVRAHHFIDAARLRDVLARAGVLP